jgi:hypothetical protein
MFATVGLDSGKMRIQELNPESNPGTMEIESAI